MIISFIRTFILYLVIILAIRIMGKRQISELQTSELVVTLLISDLAAIPMQNSGVPLYRGFIPIIVLISCEILLSSCMLKSSKFRRFICGKPMVIINDGEIDQKLMKDLRISTEDLSEQLRQMNIFTLADVAFAIIETNGKLSVLKKPEKQEVDASMLNIKNKNEGIETVVISDGEFADCSINLCGLSRAWIKDILKIEKISLKNVFIMTANRNKKYSIIKKEDQK